MNENLSLGRIAGIHVGLNWSLLVVAALIAWSLATGILPSAAPGQVSGAYWTAGIVSAFVFLASLLAHELAHSVVAMRRGVKVEGITLWLFGGVSRFSTDTSSPGATALITFVGRPPDDAFRLPTKGHVVFAAFCARLDGFAEEW